METKETGWKSCLIQPVSGGFGEWECSEFEGPSGLEPIEQMQEGGHRNFYVLGTDDLPDGVEDIRGCVRGEPDVIIVVVGEYQHVPLGDPDARVERPGLAWPSFIEIP